MNASKPEIQLRILVVNPPCGVLFALQKGKSELFTPIRSIGETIHFDFSAFVILDAAGFGIDFRGPFVQGPRGSRFVYVNSGTYAGDHGSCWNRRAKISLSPLTPDLITDALSTPGARLEARFNGTGKDGGPACASVPLLVPGWTVSK